MAQKPRTIGSYDDMLRLVPQIIEAVNKDPSLVRLFLANPILLAEEMGYTFPEELRRVVERRARFSTEAFNRLNELEKRAWELNGERFDLDSGQAVARVVYAKLQQETLQQENPPAEPETKPRRKQGGKKAEESDSAHQDEGRPAGSKVDDWKRYTHAEIARLAAPLPARIIANDPIEDPLDELRGSHPILEPLLEYRQIEASTPRLAPPALYERIKRGDVKLPVSNLKLTLKKIPTPKDTEG